jgi:uncharacterized protein YdeI (YjbR/CyaY-like superfamily)
MTSEKPSTTELPILLFGTTEEWAAWLEANQSSSPAGLWLRLAKKGAGISSVTYQQALELALCYGWIDGHKKSYDAESWLQKFTPRRAKSIWSKVNCAKVEALIESGQMRPAGLAEVERARQDGRWAAAYDSQRNASVPEDLQAALDASPAAASFFATLSSTNRYAILFRVQTAKKAETRARRIQQFIAMLEQHETIYP